MDMTVCSPEALVKRLASFCSPADFMRIQKESDQVPQDVFLSQSRWNPLQEAWAAAKFSLCLEHRLNSLKLRLVPSEFPDFELECCGQALPFEITMVPGPEKKMGKEAQERQKKLDQYKVDGDAKKLITPVDFDKAQRGTDCGPAWISAGIKLKADKRYSPPPHLLVYANFSAEELVLQEVQDLCQAYAQSFPSIWVLSSDGRHCLQLFDSPVFGQTDLCWFP